ncbi:hypothetical protein D3I06_13935 [Enterococcus faecium]|nr:hypothetical protein [Enterococcus faecium]
MLVKNVCCLESNQDALHIWFVLLCSVFKGLLHRKCFSDLYGCRSNFYIISKRQVIVNSF